MVDGLCGQQVALSTEDAIDIARRQRDQLVAAAGVLAELAGRVETVDYEALQRKIVEVAPDIAETAWGHKYLALLNPSSSSTTTTPRITSDSTWSSFCSARGKAVRA